MTNLKRLFCISKYAGKGFSIRVVLFALVLAFAACGGGGGGGGDVYVGGTGTPDTAWYYDNTGAASFTISDADELAGLAQLVNSGINFSGKTITQTVNIDLSAYAAGAGWTPIGGITQMFAGSYDGEGHTIINLKIDSSNKSWQGMFGYIDNGGNVKNIGLIDVNITITITSGSDFGGIAGSSLGTIQNCYVTGSITITGSGDSVGGIAGYCKDTQNCYTTCNISAPGSSNVGGIVGGIVSSGNVLYCYSTGDISGNNAVGGVAGVASVAWCYATGRVTGNDFVYGLTAGNAGFSVALNPSVTTTANNSTHLGRAAGWSWMNYSFARDTMVVKYNWNGSAGTDKYPLTDAEVDGINVSPGSGASANFDPGHQAMYNYNNKEFWTWPATAGAGNWDLSAAGAWQWGGNELPILRNMPKGSQNHKTQ